MGRLALLVRLLVIVEGLTGAESFHGLLFASWMGHGSRGLFGFIFLISLKIVFSETSPYIGDFAFGIEHQRIPSQAKSVDIFFEVVPKFSSTIWGGANVFLKCTNYRNCQGIVSCMT